MQHPPPRQHRIVGGVHAARDSRTAADENPFASFYESRRKISLETDDDDTSDPSSSITRAYIVPDALLALARGERESGVEQHLSVDAVPAGSGGSSLVRFVATDPADGATESTSMFRFRSPPVRGLAAEWRTVQRVALQMAAWLRRAWRRSIPN